MPSPRRALTRASAAAVVAASFELAPAQLCGVEVEWPVHRSGDVEARPSPAELRAVAAEPLPGRSRVTVEPGGQVELSTLPTGTADATLDGAATDATVLHERLRRAGLLAEDLAVDTRRASRRVLTGSRYTCMERFFAAGGEAGTWMMCNTASLQVNLSYHPVDPKSRWALAHLLGPVLVATFANSPAFDADGRRWESMRQAIWWSIDPGRTHPPSTRRSACEAWLDYALAADVMLVRSVDGNRALPIAPGLAFGRWLADGHPVGWPTDDDLRYHLTTLFPPIRPRGWLELRMLDLLPARLRDVATVVVLAALTTPAASELADRLPATGGLWCAAARHGLAHPVLAAAAAILLDTVLPHVDAVTASPRRRDDVRCFAERSVARGLSPAQLITNAELDAPHRPALRRDRATRPRPVRGQPGACAAAAAAAPAPAR